MNTFIICFFSLVPFLVFIALTDATLIDSLHSFGFIGHGATDYAARVPFNLNMIIQKMIYFWWIVFPVIILSFFLLIPDYRKTRDTLLKILPLLILSLLVLSVRPYDHYIQLIAPWSYLGWAILTNELLTNRISDRSKLIIRKVFIFIVICVFGTTAHRIILYPFDALSSQRKAQEAVAESINKVISKGSSVLIIHNPSLYALCDFYSPFHNYAFVTFLNVFAENSSYNLCEMDNLIVFDNGQQLLPPAPDDMKLKELGFTKTATISRTIGLKTDTELYKIYRRLSPCL